MLSVQNLDSANTAPPRRDLYLPGCETSRTSERHAPRTPRRSLLLTRGEKAKSSKRLLDPKGGFRTNAEHEGSLASSFICTSLITFEPRITVASGDMHVATYGSIWSDLQPFLTKYTLPPAAAGLC